MRISDWSSDVCSSDLNLLRYTNNMAGGACHVVASATQVGLTQVLGLMRKLIAPAALTFSCLCSASPVTSLKADPAIYRVTLAHIEAEFCKAPQLTAEAKASPVRQTTAVTGPGRGLDKNRR